MTTDLADRLEALAGKATPGPWAYRPDEFDDWGVVKSPPRAVGDYDPPFILRGMIGQFRDPDVRCEAVLNEHRRAGTDPWEDNAALIVELRNALPEIVAALHADEWQDIATAPINTPVRVKAGSMAFLARLIPDASMTIEVTQADRDAAEKWGTGPVYNMQHLAEAFARHRIAAGQATSEWKAVTHEQPPHGAVVLLWWQDWSGAEYIEAARFSTGQRYPNGYSDYSEHGYATHWQMPPSTDAIRALKIEGE